MLFKLSLKNLRKSVKDYTIYFFTLILGIAIFYVFNSLESTTVLMDLSRSKLDIITMLNQILSFLSIFVSFVLGFLIVYASQFLIKRRKKEFGTYMLLGMGKTDISKILLIETLLIGLVSLVVGLIVGVFASQFMSILVARMFEADMSKYIFTFSSDAMVMTILFFAIIYITVMVFNTFSVGKAKLIDLLNAAKRNERVAIKNVYVSILLFILSIAILAYAYYRVTAGIPVWGLELNELGYCIVLGCIGTFLFFYSLSGFLLKMMQSNKRLYLRNLNMFVVRQMNAKINTTAVSMSVICLMLFFTICILSSGLAINKTMTNDLKTYSPVDFNAYYRFAPDQIDIAFHEEDMDDVLLQQGIDPKEVFSDTAHFTTYYDPYLTFAAANPDFGKEAEGNMSLFNTGMIEEIIPLSSYNELAKLYGMPTYTLNDNEYMVICDFDEMKTYRDITLKNKTKLTIQGKTYTPKYDSCQEGFLYIAPMAMNVGVIIVPDEAINGLLVMSVAMAGNYSDETIANVEALDEKLQDAFYSGVGHQAIQEHGGMINFNTKTYNYEGSIGTGAITTFIGLYLGIIFLISSAAILALKELSESEDNRGRYMVLRKIGVDEKSINHALFAQIGIFFLLPVGLAIVHSYFGIQFANTLLPFFFNDGLVTSILTTALFLSAIYGGYFLITYFSSKRIIK